MTAAEEGSDVASLVKHLITATAAANATRFQDARRARARAGEREAGERERKVGQARRE